jgi:hypothetical protein
MRYSRRRLILPAVFCLALLAPPAQAGELYGTVYTGGAPAANLTFSVKGRKERVATDSSGRYSVDLPPGEYVLIIKGKDVPVTVKPERTLRDVRL